MKNPRMVRTVGDGTDTSRLTHEHQMPEAHHFEPDLRISMVIFCGRPLTVTVIVACAVEPLSCTSSRDTEDPGGSRLRSLLRSVADELLHARRSISSKS